MIRTHIRIFASSLLMLFLGASLHAAAHHSASQFDFAQRVEVTGKIKSIAVENPHIDLWLTVEKEDGTVKDIQFEGHSRNNVYRKGWRPDMMEAGDEISIFIAPMRNGDDGGYIQSFKLADGTEF